MAKILIVEDDESLGPVIEQVLTDERHLVDRVLNVADCKAYLDSVTYDMLVVDWNLPDGSGVDVCMEYRRKGGTSPILMLTGRTDVDDKVSGLDAGADDYLTKPFHTRELTSRVRALLRRPPVVTNKILKARDITLDPLGHTVKRGDEVLKLYPKEFTLLELFMRNPNRLFSANDLLDRVWPTDSDASVETVRTTIQRLRQRVESEDDNKQPLIQTVRGVGYRLQP